MDNEKSEPEHTTRKDFAKLITIKKNFTMQEFLITYMSDSDSLLHSELLRQTIYLPQVEAFKTALDSVEMIEDCRAIVSITQIFPQP